ncbi:MAG: tyrosine-protein phosphatase [Ilumatobacteraceae bacterium]
MEQGLVDPVVDPRRLVALDAVHNFRDLGGYPARDGTVTRWRTIFRADGLHRLTPSDLDVIRAIGLRTVLDLRSQPELDEHGTFPSHEVDVTFTHHPVIDTTWDREAHADVEAHDFLVWAYTEMLAQGAPRFAAAITALAEPGALPAVFHCAAGKDRTGLLAALLLSALGVPRTVVLADYALTADAMVRMREWATRTYPEMAARFAEVPSAFFAALPEALADVLAAVDVEHGSVGTYLARIGVADDTIESLARSFLSEP